MEVRPREERGVESAILLQDFIRANGEDHLHFLLSCPLALAHLLNIGFKSSQATKSSENLSSAAFRVRM
jgi:hypothetical protein